MLDEVYQAFVKTTDYDWPDKEMILTAVADECDISIEEAYKFYKELFKVGSLQFKRKPKGGWFVRIYGAKHA